jgi:hypothetical protein
MISPFKLIWHRLLGKTEPHIFSWFAVLDTILYANELIQACRLVVCDSIAMN